MKAYLKIAFLSLCLVVILPAQSDISWSEITNQYSLPAGVRLFQGTRVSPALNIFYFDVDLNQSNIAVRPYITTTPDILPALTVQFGAFAAVNGGFFGGSTSYSAVLYPDLLKAQNVATVTRNSLTYPVIRSFFSLDRNFNPSLNWIYHFGSTAQSIYRFNAPLPYSYNDPNPKPTPTPEQGTPLTNLLVGIGGAPTLLKNGQINLTYNEEIMWGSGVGLDNNDPRTAVGFTTNKHVILLTADGRQTNSQGVSLTELAQILLNLGCSDAMNLDGGGSTQMTIGSTYINHPSEYRKIPTILAIVNRDSVRSPLSNKFETIIDTGDSACTLIGNDWFPSANPGYWGTTKAMLNTQGTGDKQAIFDVTLDKTTECQLYAWWVAASNRCLDTPFIIRHAKGIDTVRVDQTVKGSQWNFIGKYTFSYDPAHAVIISNAARQGTYIVADAIKLVTDDSVAIVLRTKPTDQTRPLAGFYLEQNYPNPFNATTFINFHLSQSSIVNLSLYNISGQFVARLIDAQQFPPGDYRYVLKADHLPSGIYFYALETTGNRQFRKMLILK